MEVHKPKPWHGVREFLKEYAIIVIGVLTALGAEQAAEWLHWRHQLGETRRAIREELEYGAYSALERVTIERCEHDRLDDLRARLLASGDDWPCAPLSTDNWQGPGGEMAYRTPTRRWNTSAWEAVTASAASGRMDPEEMNKLGTAHELLQVARRANDAEAADVAALSQLAQPGRLSADARERLVAVTFRARREQVSRCAQPHDPEELRRHRHRGRAEGPRRADRRHAPHLRRVRRAAERLTCKSSYG